MEKIILTLDIDTQKSSTKLEELKTLLGRQRAELRNIKNTSSKAYEVKQKALKRTETAYKVLNKEVKAHEKEIQKQAQVTATINKLGKKQNLTVKEQSELLKALKVQRDNINRGTEKGAIAYKNLTSQIKTLTQDQLKMRAESGNARQSLAVMRQELEQMIVAGQGGSEEFKNLRAEAARLQDQIDKADYKVLNKEVKEHEREIQKQAQATTTINKLGKEQNLTVKQQSDLLKALKIERDNINRGTEEGAIAYENLTSQIKTLTQDQSKMRAESGNARQSLAVMRQELEQMIIAGKGGSEEFKTLRIEAARLQDQIDKADYKVLNKEVKAHEREIQKQAQATATINKLGEEQNLTVKQQSDLLKALKIERDNINRGTEQGAIAYENLTSQIKTLTHDQRKMRAESGNARQSLTVMRQELQQMIIAGQGGSQEFKNLRAEASQLQDQIDTANAQVKLFADDFYLIRAATETMQGLSGVVQVSTGVLSALNIESDAFEKNMQRMMAAMSVAQGIERVSNMLRKESALMLVAKATATKGATLAQVLYNKTLITTMALLKSLGIGWLIAAVSALTAAVVLLVKNWDKVVKGFKSFTNIFRRGKKDMEDLGEETDKTTQKVETLETALKRLEHQSKRQQTTIEREIELMKKRGDSIDDIRKKEKELLMFQIKSTKQRVEMQVAEQIQIAKTLGRYNEQTEALIRQRLIEEEGLDILLHKKELFNIESEKLENDRIEKQKENNKRAIDEQKKLAEAELKANQRAIEEEKKLAQAEFKARLELAVKKAETDKEELQARVKQAEELFRIETEGMNKTSSQYKLMKLDLNKKLLSIQNDYIEEVEEIEEDHSKRLMELRKANATNETELYELKKQEIEERRMEELAQFQDDQEMYLELELYYRNKLEELDKEHQDILLQNELDRIEEERQANLKGIKATQNMTKASVDAITSFYEEGSERQKDIQRTAAKFMGGLRLGETLINTQAAIMSALASQNYAGALLAGVKGALATATIIGEMRSFDTGGYTGDGGKLQPAGFVHKGEYVINKENTQALGWQNIESSLPFKNSAKGSSYQTGGLVGFGETGGVFQDRENMIIEAMRDIRPIVTVEDINAKTQQENNRVEVSKI